MPVNGALVDSAPMDSALAGTRHSSIVKGEKKGFDVSS